ncbi:FAD-dependent oxidoreductase [Sporosarcina sp. ACRSL]|uniref:phytoene desaturase family protein n=1 Tax=Sporosarcina sp. ACRSL TaxID=2918215 RepID=UPI001EF658B7|nr:FAD-dependent oxidoreductase [Sporosarcina sp. ACRSL]MCG7346262.1 FAD-dependent oxidoreductase [Sporosarcina sp. ACRSL]
MKQYDVAIVGGGISGLASAIYVARSGYSVILLEKSNQLGGRGQTIRKKKAMLNLGVHAFYQDGKGESVLKELGISLKGANPSASAVGVWKNKVHAIPTGPLQLFSDNLFSLKGKMSLTRLMLKLNKIDTEKIGTISLKEWAEKEIHDPMVRFLLYAISRSNTYVPYPDLHLAGPALRQLQRTFSGKVMYIREGWETIIEDLTNQATLLGVTIMNHRNVSEIKYDSRVQKIVFNNGETLEVPKVIVTAGLEETYHLVNGAENTKLALWKSQARPVHVACLDLVLRKLPQPDADFIAGFWIDQPIFYNNPTYVTKMSDDGSVVIHLAKHLGTSTGNPKLDLHELEQAMDVVQPGWRVEEITRQFLPHMTASHDFNSLDRNDFSPGPSVPEIPGLFVAGDWTGRGELLVDASLDSAKRAALAVIEELKVEGDMYGHRRVIQRT